MKSKKTLFSILITIVLLGVMSCARRQENANTVNAMVVIMGRHANANEFHEESYEAVKKYVKNTLTLHGGYVGVISSEGTPRLFDEGRFDYFKVKTKNTREQKKQISENISFVMDFLKSDTNRAVTQENDLLRAIQLARRELDVFEQQAKRSGKQIGEKRIVIMSNGIVTAGHLDFSTRNIDNFDFSVPDNEKIKEFASVVAKELSSRRALPDLKGINIVFIGLERDGVALPQRELSENVENGLRILWKTILEKANADSIEILRTPSTNRANDDGFPEVRPIEFLENTGWPISDEQVSFNFGQSTFSNPQEAVNNLRRFADTIIRYIRGRPDVRIFVVGSESKNRIGRYTPALSESRARAVMDTLARFGVPRDRMEAFGLAVYLPGRENDRPNGEFDSIIGKRNQKVVIIPSDISNQAFLREVLDTRDRLYGKQ